MSFDLINVIFHSFDTALVVSSRIANFKDGSNNSTTERIRDSVAATLSAAVCAILDSDPSQARKLAIFSARPSPARICWPRTAVRPATRDAPARHRVHRKVRLGRRPDRRRSGQPGRPLDGVAIAVEDIPAPGDKHARAYKNTHMHTNTHAGTRTRALTPTTTSARPPKRNPRTQATVPPAIGPRRPRSLTLKRIATDSLVPPLGPLRSTESGEAAETLHRPRDARRRRSAAPGGGGGGRRRRRNRGTGAGRCA